MDLLADGHLIDRSCSRPRCDWLDEACRSHSLVGYQLGHSLPRLPHQNNTDSLERSHSFVLMDPIALTLSKLFHTDAATMCDLPSTSEEYLQTMKSACSKMRSNTSPSSTYL